MKIKRGGADGFNLSFLDVMACGLGAVILIFILVDFKAFTADPAEEAQKLEQELAAAENEQQQLQKSIDEINQRIALESSKQDADEDSQQDTDEQLKKINQDIATQLAVIADLEKQKAAVAKNPTSPDNIDMSGSGEQNYITGLKVEGKHIGILVDKSASMMADTVLKVLGATAKSDNEKVAMAKWVRTKRVAQWLLARLPNTSKVTMVAFSEQAKPLGLRPINSAAVPESLKALETDLGKVVPEGGTDLENGLKELSKANPQLTDVYIITDGLPTKGGGLPLKCRNFISRSKSISSDCRRSLFLEAVKSGPRGAKINVILLPIEGDPYAPSLYWQWTLTTGGTFLSPAKEWP